MQPIPVISCILTAETHFNNVRQKTNSESNDMAAIFSKATFQLNGESLGLSESAVDLLFAVAEPILHVVICAYDFR